MELDGVGVAVGFTLFDRFENVVVVDQPDLDLAVGDRVADDAVLLIGASAVGLHLLEPLFCLRLAFAQPHRGDERLERGVCRRPTNLPFPARLGQIEDRFRQLAGSERAAVVSEHADAAAGADPVALG